MMKRTFSLLALYCSTVVSAQQPVVLSQVWNPDLGNGSYKNPVINADYSDPDAIRVGDDYYLISSSFNAAPGIPILHSKDLVNWQIIGHALKEQIPLEHFREVQHGNGVWAPAIRYHNNEFYIYYPDPDFGIYLIKAKDIKGPWTAPVLVEAGVGLIDPCPFWDDDGKLYLAHGWAGSRAGLKSIITIKQLNEDGKSVVHPGQIVYDGHEKDPTVEGPKLHKRNGYYYIFAPAGGVSPGWQIVLRSKNIYGPYERRIVMEQGNTAINGPHQGAWIETKEEDWFLHFQDKGVYGRVLHLQPMKWNNDWPVIGVDENNDGIGNPVATYKKPKVSAKTAAINPAESDEFDGTRLGLQWQWQANAMQNWYALTGNGKLRLYSSLPSDTTNLWNIPNLLMQKTPADAFTASTKLIFYPKNEKMQGEETGLVMLGKSYARLYLQHRKDGIYLMFGSCANADKNGAETKRQISKLKGNEVELILKTALGGRTTFYYKDERDKLVEAGNFLATEGQWVGAKIGLFCTRKFALNDGGYADFEWFRITP